MDVAGGRPAIRIVTPDGEPFRAAAGSPALSAAYDELIGAGRWSAGPGVGGTVPVHVADGFALDGSDRSPVARAVVEGLADTSQLRAPDGSPSSTPA